MDLIQDLTDAMSQTLEMLCHLLTTIIRIWYMPAEEDRYTQFLIYLLALPEALSDISNSLARGHELATALRAQWDNANSIGRVVIILGLTISLSKSQVPDLIRVMYHEYIQGRFEVYFQSFWGSSSLEGKVAMMFFLGWLLLYASLRYVQRLRHER